jgi:hypothetical protein
MMMVQSVMPQEDMPTDNYVLLKNQQQRLPWRVHQSEAVLNKGKGDVGKIARGKR